MKVKALTGFSHGGFNPSEGEEIDVPEPLGKQLQARGLVGGGTDSESREAREEEAQKERARRQEEAAQTEAERQRVEFEEVQRREELLRKNQESNEKMATPMENRMVTPKATKVDVQPAVPSAEADPKKAAGAAPAKK